MNRSDHDPAEYAVQRIVENNREVALEVTRARNPKRCVVLAELLKQAITELQQTENYALTRADLF